MRQALAPTDVPKHWLDRCEGQQLGDFDLCLVPFENQHTIGGQHAKALGKALAQVFAPVFAELSVLRCKPAFWTGPHQVRWVKRHKFEAAIGKGMARKSIKVSGSMRIVRVPDSLP
jgi:hypothetical protein